MKKNELQKRVNNRKNELAEQTAGMTAMLEKVAQYCEEVRSCSAVYVLVKNMQLWREIEALVENKRI